MRVGLAGLGYWGPNLARNFDDLAELAWLCDLARPARPVRRSLSGRAHDGPIRGPPRGRLASGRRRRRTWSRRTASSRAARSRPASTSSSRSPALAASEADELVALAEERNLVLLPGHLLLYHPAVAKLKELVESGELGDVLYLYGNRQNLGQIRKDENALWSLGVHDLSVILHLIGEEPSEVWARGESYHNEGVEDIVFCYLRFPSGVVAHMHLSWLDPHKKREMTVVGKNKMAVFDDMDLERKITVYDKGTEQRAESYGEWRTRTGDIYIPKIPNDEPLRLECRHFLARRRRRRPDRRRDAARRP